MNEQTHFFIKIYLSDFILERVDVSMVCERWVETRTGCYIDPTSSFDAMSSSKSHLALLPHLGGGCSTGDRRGTQPSESVLNLQAGFTLTFQITWLNSRRHLPIIFHNTYLLPLLLPLIYTGASLIYGSVKGQYIHIVGCLRVSQLL